MAFPSQEMDIESQSQNRWVSLVNALRFKQEEQLRGQLRLHKKRTFPLRRNQVNFLVYGQDSKKIGSVGQQNKNNILHRKHRRKTRNL